jgi:hypothetical protein
MLRTYRHARAHARTRARTHAGAHARTHIQARTHTLACTRSHAHTHRRMHTRTHARTGARTHRILDQRQRLVQPPEIACAAALSTRKYPPVPASTAQSAHHGVAGRTAGLACSITRARCMLHATCPLQCCVTGALYDVAGQRTAGLAAERVRRRVRHSDLFLHPLRRNMLHRVAPCCILFVLHLVATGCNTTQHSARRVHRISSRCTASHHVCTALHLAGRADSSDGVASVQRHAQQRLLTHTDLQSGNKPFSHRATCGLQQHAH